MKNQTEFDVLYLKHLNLKKQYFHLLDELKNEKIKKYMILKSFIFFLEDDAVYNDFLSMDYKSDDQKMFLNMFLVFMKQNWIKRVPNL